MNITDYTLEVVKQDRRYKLGERRVLREDYTAKTYSEMLDTVRQLRETVYQDPHYIISFEETHVTQVNLMTGTQYQERRDRPHSCSPASESYWSM